MELKTAKDRDRVVAAAPKLKNMNAQSVFGEGGNSIVSIRQLWPKKVHSLFRDFLRVCKQFRFPRFIVSNLVVCVRKSKNQTFTPLLSQEDLHNFLAVPTAKPSPMECSECSVAAVAVASDAVTAIAVTANSDRTPWFSRSTHDWFQFGRAKLTVRLDSFDN